jgi:hypothetical protein
MGASIDPPSFIVFIAAAPAIGDSPMREKKKIAPAA